MPTPNGRKLWYHVPLHTTRDLIWFHTRCPDCRESNLLDFDRRDKIADIVRCPHCGKTFSFSELVSLLVSLREPVGGITEADSITVERYVSRARIDELRQLADVLEKNPTFPRPGRTDDGDDSDG